MHQTKIQNSFCDIYIYIVRLSGEEWEGERSPK